MDTSRLDSRDQEPEQPRTTPEGIDLGIMRLWRIALIVEPAGVQLIFELMDMVTIGRNDVKSQQIPDIDLRPFDAERLGVSRLHLFVKLEGENIVVIDNRSLNGTKLNGSQLEPGKAVPIRDGDSLMLGALNIKVALLAHPMD